MEIEKQYVHEVYSRLASHCAETESKKKLRIWPHVKKFIDELPPGSIVIDVDTGFLRESSGRPELEDHIHVARTQEGDVDELRALNKSFKSVNCGLTLNGSFAWCGSSTHIKILSAENALIEFESTEDDKREEKRCGQMKYEVGNGFLLGSDICPEVLLQVHKSPLNDVHLADALHLPYRDESIDAALFVSVVHHFTSLERRRKSLAEIARCLRRSGRILIYAWAFEQPNGSFKSQDVLVPWHLHENPSNGRLPLVKFHFDSTKEQRIIQGSLPIDVLNPQPSTATQSIFTSVVDGILGRFWSTSRGRPPSVPKYFSPKGNRVAKIVSGIGRWSPALSHRLASLVIGIEEQLAEELSETILTEAIQEALSTLQKVTFYRFYHVFRKDELEELVAMVPSLRVISVQYEYANWCLLAEKCDPFTSHNK